VHTDSYLVSCLQAKVELPDQGVILMSHTDNLRLLCVARLSCGMVMTLLPAHRVC
jgi:hypothetical protein